MANIANRSPWVVLVGTKEVAKFQLKSKAKAYLDELNNPKAKMVQLETAFQVQVKRVDKDGNIIQLNQTCPTLAEAKKWADEKETEILEYKKTYGKFNTTQETMTLEEGFNRVLEEHYKENGMSSYNENKYRAPHIVEYFGKHKLMKDLTVEDARKYRDFLKEKGYAPSSIRNYFALLSRLYKHSSEWSFRITNPTVGVKLPTVDNAIERFWENKDEEKKLMEAIEQYRPNLKPIMLLCLDLAFRIGELLPKAMHDKHGNEINQDRGLFWKHIHFDKNIIRLPREKNDHTKRNTEFKGREVPLTEKSKKVLLALRNEQGGNPSPEARVFPFSYNTVRPQLDYCCEKAGIKNFTWHSTRKIGSVNVGNRVHNVLQQAKITGHKTIQILSDRYFKPSMEDLKALLDEIDTENPILRGFLLLEKHMGKEMAEEIVKFIQKTKTKKDGLQINQLKELCERQELEEANG